MEFSVLIPTYNRPADLLACLDSIAMQSPRPVQCVLVDDGALSQTELALVQERLGTIGLTYHRKNHAKEQRGQSASKNIGLRLATQEIVFILDDDVVLGPNFFPAVTEIWRSRDCERLMGVGGFIENLREKGRLESLYNAFFLLSSRVSWDITPVGFQVWDDQMAALQKAYYVHGGLCSVRKSEAVRFPFVTFGGGRAFLEDVDFCMRAKNAGYHFYMEPKARALHNTSLASRDSMLQVGWKESANRRKIFRSNVSPSFRHQLWFCWSSIGWVLKQFLAGNFRKAIGMVIGFVGR